MQNNGDNESILIDFNSFKENDNIESIVEDALSKEKYSDGIYKDKIEFIEMLNQRDNSFIRQINDPTLNTAKSGSSIIPKKIFQTHKSIEFISRNPKLMNAINSWRKYSKEFEYYFYTDEICEKFMKENFEGEIYDAYKKLPISVMKADLWRYCVVYKYGGIYADADTICLTNPNYLLKNANKLFAHQKAMKIIFVNGLLLLLPGLLH